MLATFSRKIPDALGTCTNDLELITRRHLVKAAVLLRSTRRLSILLAAVLIATSVSQTAVRADTRDVQNIGLPLVLPLTPAQLANDRRFRQTFGFRSDDAYIATLYDQVARDVLPGASRNWAALLTADEAANMTRRQQLAEIVGPSPLGTDSARLTAFGRFLRSRIGEFGGEYFDQLADGAVVVLVTANAADYTAALAPILGSRADHLRVVAAAHTYQELLTLTQRLADDSAWLKDHGVVLSSFGPDAVSNTVIARVPAVTDAVKAVLQSRYPGAPVRAVEGPPVRTTGAHDLEAPPMMGGLGMWRCDSSSCLSAVGCTSGFIVNNGGSAPTYAVMGAGHCGGGFDWVQGTPYSGGQYTVGDTASVSFGTLGDAEVIPLFAQQDGTHSPQVYLSTTSCGLGCTQHNVRAISGSEASTTVGEVTCASRSQEADEICGSVTAVDQCVFYQAENTTVCHQIFANFPDTFGDSGGPLYQPQASSGRSVAQGIASGSDLQTFTTNTQIAAAFAAISSAGGGSWSACPAAWSSTYVGETSWATLNPGETTSVVVQWQNSGCNSWNMNQTGAQAFAGTWNPTPGQDLPSVLGGASNGTCGTGTNWWACNRVRPSADIVNPGQVADFAFDVKAPPAPGTYQTYLRPVVEGVTWMEDQGVYWQMTVRTPQGPSRYMKTVDATSGGVIYKEGCIAGGDVASRYGGPYTPQTGVVVLDFGQPWFDAASGNYGSMLFNNGFVTTSQVLSAAEAWAQGYWDCSTTVPTIRIAVGTNNLATRDAVGNFTASYTNAAHGKAWANMVSSFANWIITNRYDSRLSAAGASDMELGWNTAANTRNWSCVMNADGVCTDGFGSVSGQVYYNYGDAAGCPPFGTCFVDLAHNVVWTQEDVWYDSWGSPPAWPLPEIYNDGTAQEWYQLSLYGYTRHARSMTIKGAFTQYAACQSVAGCPGSGTDYTPQQGWTGLWNYINKDSRTIQAGTGELRWSTDITWAN